MKMISLLVTLGIIGFVVWKQLGGGTAPAAVTDVGSVQRVAPPRVSSNPADLPQFEADMDQYLQRQSSQRRQDIDAQTD